MLREERLGVAPEQRLGPEVTEQDQQPPRARVDPLGPRQPGAEQPLAQGTYEFDSQTLAKVLIDKELRWIRT